MIRFWHRHITAKAQRHVSGDAPVIRFWQTSMGERFYSYVQWVKVPLDGVDDVPGFIKPKTDKISTRLPDATFTAEELRSERSVYDPFLIVCHGDESYYVEVWSESDFERRYT